MIQWIIDNLIQRQNKQDKEKRIKVGKIKGIEVYLAPNQKDEHIKKLIETEYISKDKIAEVLDYYINLYQTGIDNCSKTDEKLKEYYICRKKMVQMIRKDLLGEGKTDE